MKKLLIFIIVVFTVKSLSYTQGLSDTINLEEVVITGTKVEVARKNVPMTVSVISGKVIEQSDESSILPVISENIPGVFVTERGITGYGVYKGAAGFINIRGLGGSPTTQVLMLIDGHPQFMGMMGHHLPDNYVASDIEKVEIIRGPASILYGSNAMGGVINIITKKQNTDGTKYNGRILYGSYNTQKYMGKAGFKKKGFSVFGSINHDRTDGHRDTSDFKITNGYIKAGYNFNNKWNILADLSMAKFDASDPGPESGKAGVVIDIFRGKTALSVENTYNNFKGALKLYYNFGEHKITDGWHSNDELYGLMFYQGINIFSGNTITLGYDRIIYGGKGSPINTVLRDDDGNIIPGPDGPQFTLAETNNKWVTMSHDAVYSFVQQTLFESLIINAGLRYEINSYYGNEFIPQTGFSYHLSELTSFKGSVSKGYRPPSIRELYFFPPANDELKPEKITNYELSWIQDWFANTLKTEITGFIFKGDNMIVMVPAVSPPPPQYKNTGEFQNLGIEFSGKYSPFSNLDISANYTYINMKEKLLATPEHNLFLSGTYRYKKFIFNLKLQNILNLYNENQDGIVDIIENNYHVLGAKINYRAFPFMDIFFSGDNILNEKYHIHYDYPMPGISFMAGINIRGSIKGDIKM
jgi:outer membrane receptor protein involved in Fe transport